MAEVITIMRPMSRWVCMDCGAVGAEYRAEQGGESVARGGAAVHERNCPERAAVPGGESNDAT